MLAIDLGKALQCLGINGSQAFHRPPRFLRATGKCVGRCCDSGRRYPVGFLAQGAFCPRASFVKTSSKEMSKSSSRLHMIETGIEWAQPHRVGQVRNGNVCVTRKASDQATEHPCTGEVWA